MALSAVVWSFNQQCLRSHQIRIQQSVLDGTNGLSSFKPCAYCRIVHRADIFAIAQLSCNLWVPGFPQISAPPNGETASDPKMFWRCKNVIEVLYHHGKFGGARTLPDAMAAKNV